MVASPRSTTVAAIVSNFDMGYNTIVETNNSPKQQATVYLDSSATSDVVNFHNNIVSLNNGDSLFKREGAYHSSNEFYLYSTATHLYNSWSMALNPGESFGPLSYGGI